ncbi:MAG: molybdopterin molybdotransferase MoeA [Gammaproteobacteria bacterium]|nr:molybdopterin molybdotransferase MoeA [Gammaproteobacteria bacterium]
MSETSPLREAQEKFVQAVAFRSLARETRNLDQLLGATLHQAVTAPMDSPPYPRAIVEGYLVSSASTQSASEENPVSFNIIGSVNPGDANCPDPGKDGAIETVTGSVVATGDFAIARMWECKVDGDKVSVSRPFPPGFFIEAQGCDIAKGSEILAAGQVLDVVAIGTLASLGLNQAQVCMPPRVAVFASGDEVIPHTDSFRIGAIYDCNTPMLSAAVNAAGGIAVAKGIQGDDFDAFVKTARQALQENDMLLISGGTAVGGRDFISDLIRELGELLVDGVPMKSGRPLIMGIAQGKPIVCVAGHPPEALRGFRLFGIAAINRMLGRDLPLPEDN